jgi:hypothetical protein
MAVPIVNYGSLLVALCSLETRQAPSCESWWDDGLPGTDPLPLREPDSD